MPVGHCGGGGVTQFGYVPVVPTGHFGGGGVTQFGYVPVVPTGHTGGRGIAAYDHHKFTAPFGGTTTCAVLPGVYASPPPPQFSPIQYETL